MSEEQLQHHLLARDRTRLFVVTSIPSGPAARRRQHALALDLDHACAAVPSARMPSLKQGAAPDAETLRGL
jgi:hypothetical protein